MNDSYRGRCHCGALGFVFATQKAPETWRIRSCQCSFCRAHGARTTTDPQGSVRFEVADDGSLRRYRFGLQTADFLLCAACGTYLAAVMSTSKGRYATLNTNCLHQSVEGLAPTAPVSYDDETAAQRNARREKNWTPVAGDFA